MIMKWMTVICCLIGLVLSGWLSLASADEEKGKAAADTEVAAKLKESKIGKLVAGAKLQLVEGEQFKEAAMKKAPQYYILYYSASY